jgi:hypothetical protein
MKKVPVFLIFICCCTGMAAQFRVGAGRVKITPDSAIWMSGYASRNKPSQGVLQDLWVKAVVIEENSKSRAVIVTADIIGLSHTLSEEVAERISDRYGITRSQLLINSSHTHSGPVIWPSLSVMYNLSTGDLKALMNYSRKLSDDFVEAVGLAMRDLAPGKIRSGHGFGDIATNRRQPTDKGVIIGVNPSGPVDHDVMVVKFETADGMLKAVLFGYACHNTTLSDYLINGDYAGFAQADLENQNPGTVALFIQGCGADQNPEPRRSVEIAETHGRSLAAAVQKVLEENLNEVRPPIRTAFTTTELEFPEFNSEKYKNEIIEGDRFQQQRARLMLEAFDKGYDVTRLRYPVQALRFNKDLTILALSGEVVVDYSLTAKKMYPSENLFVAGYCTEVPCYIPTRNILHEGGYEPETSMIYYGLPGPFKDNVEEKIFAAVRQVMKSTGAKQNK